MFGLQQARIEYLLDKVDVIITDSPVILSAIYGPKKLILADDNTPSSWVCAVTDIFQGDVSEKPFTNINFLLDPVVPENYVVKGRNQSYEESLEIYKKIKWHLDYFCIHYTKVSHKDDNELGVRF